MPQIELDSRTDVAGPPSKMWLQEAVFLDSTGSYVGWISWLESTHGIIPLPAHHCPISSWRGSNPVLAAHQVGVGFVLGAWRSSWLEAVSWQCGRSTNLDISKSTSIHAYLQIHTHTLFLPLTLKFIQQVVSYFILIHLADCQ